MQFIDPNFYYYMGIILLTNKLHLPIGFFIIVFARVRTHLLLLTAATLLALNCIYSFYFI